MVAARSVWLALVSYEAAASVGEQRGWDRIYDQRLVIERRGGWSLTSPHCGEPPQIRL